MSPTIIFAPITPPAPSLWARLESRTWVRVVFIVAGFCAPAVAILYPDTLPMVLGIALVVTGLLYAPWNELTAFSVLLGATFLLPANLVIGPLGQAGRPCMLIAAIMFMYWSFDRIVPGGESDRRRQPIRVLAILVVMGVLASYGLAQIRGMTTIEANGADAGLMVQISVLGLLLFSADVPGTANVVRRILARIVAGAAFLSTAGILQYFQIIDLSGAIRLPGLKVHTSNSDFIVERDGLYRVAGTATHPIEYGVVLSLVLPLALHFALKAPKGKRFWPWLAVAVIAAGIPLAVSRSAVLATMVALGVYFLTTKLRVLLNLLPLAVLGLIAVQAATPGVLGGILQLFRAVDDDPSIHGRTADYEIVFRYWAEYPLFGLGPGTFVPKLYIVLDNEYLYELVTLGATGLIVRVALFWCGYVFARRVSRFAADPADRDLGQALAGAIAAAAVAAATFDAFGFTIMLVVTHVLIGLSGALWRTTVRDPALGISRYRHLPVGNPT
ncbi:O-antigen ligase family protein [Actinokineospora xionganensis]|uniref:O-antigen ligase family protein n=1 Tax=Actinokineospora xionganensis TaxID=2684470 RepID=A0ABR7L253_9PSEU|nr:O-antigen ligase family protein [Actinokineospora xionganensis]MBC6446603.1 O-antigen ligase family protein [Actinokineospora xionganensis]